MRVGPNCTKWRRTVQAPSKCSMSLTIRHRTGISVRLALTHRSAHTGMDIVVNDDPLHKSYNRSNECIRTITEPVGPNGHRGLQVSESQIDVDYNLVLP